MTYRVVQWGTGWLGTQTVHTILEHPDLELVGVFTASDDKHGKDVGDLVGLPPVGITATSSVDDVLALGADCHLFLLLGAEAGTVEPAVEKLVTILEAGQNVCQTSLIPMLYPKYAPAEMRDPIAAACATGNARFHTTGLFPGVIDDVFAAHLLACAGRVDTVRIVEMFNYGEYYSAAFARQMGIGTPMRDATILAQALADHGSEGHLGPAMRNLGDRLGVTLDEIRLVDVAFEPAVAPAQVEDLMIEPGTIGAYRIRYEGRVAGRTVVEVWFVTRWDHAAAPDWPAPRGASTGCYRIEVGGSLTLSIDVDIFGRRDTRAQTRGFPTSSAVLGANLMGAGTVVNAIPHLCRAEPGVYGASDLPRDHDLHALRSS